MANNQITFGVGFKVDESGLKNLKQQLQDIQNLSTRTASIKIDASELNEIKKMAHDVELALDQAFNSNLGSYNLTTLQQNLKNLPITEIANKFNGLGAQGRAAFTALQTSVLSANTQLKSTWGFLDKISETLSNTIRWNIASSAINSFTAAVSGAFSYVQSLDRSLTSIRVVTGDSREEMAKFAVEANNAAQALGRQTKEYTNAALTFYQQGLDDEQVRARTEAVLKAQNITNSGSEMADYLTAVWNGFKVSAENTTEYVDKLAAVADSSASDMSELAIAMSKVASTANNMGVTVDQLTAQIATIVATTRVAPETVGNALKTIYARINDIKTGTDEAEISLGQYTGRMRSLGINVLDSNGRLRDTGDVMTEIGEKWSSMSREQQIYLAQTMAGQRQMNNLVSLFDNWQTYTNMLNVSLNSTGTLEEKNARYLESVEAHYKNLQAAVEGFQDALINEEDLKTYYDVGTALMNSITKFISAIGGSRTVVMALSSTLLGIFNKQLTTVISNIATNIQNIKFNAAQTARLQQWREDFARLARDTGVREAVRNNVARVNDAIDQVSEYRAVWQEGDQAAATDIVARTAALETQRDVIREITQQSVRLAQRFVETGKASVNLGNITTATFNLEGAEKDNEALKQQAQSRSVVSNVLEDLGNRFTDVQKAIQDNIEQIDKNSDALNKANSKTEEYKQKLEDLEKAFQRGTIEAKAYDKQQAELNKKINAQADAENRAKKNLDESKLAIEDLRQEMETLQNSLPEDSPFRQPLEALITNLNKVENAAASSGNVAQSAINGLQRNFQQLLATTQANSASMANYEQEVRKTRVESNALKLTLQELEQKWKNLSAAQAVVSLSQGVTSLLAAFQAFRNIGNILEDDSLTNFEKAEQIIRALAMAVPMVVASVGALQKGLTALTLNLTKVNTSERTHLLLTQGLTKATLSEIIANSGLITRLRALVVSLGEATRRMVSFLLTDPVGWAILATGAIVGMIAAWKHAQTTEERYAKHAREQAVKLQKNYSDIKESFESLKTSLEEYEGMREALDQLTIGTQAWYDAADALNNKILEILDNYPQLAAYVKQDENGNLYLDERGVNEYNQQRRDEVLAARAAAVRSQSQSNERNLRADIEDLTNRNNIRGITQTAQKDFIIQLIQDPNFAQNIANADQYGTIWADWIREHISDLQQLHAQYEANNKYLEVNNVNLAHQIGLNSNNTIYTTASTDTQALIDQLVAKRLNAIDKDIQQSYANKSDDVIAAEFAQQHSGYRAVGNKVYDENNDEIDLSIDDMRQELQSLKQYERVRDTEYTDIVSKVINTTTDAGKAVLKFVATGRLDEQTSIREMRQYLAESHNDVYALAEQLGYEIPGELLSQLYDALNIAEEDIQKNLERLTPTVRNLLQDAGFDDPEKILSIENRNYLFKVVQGIFDKYGTDTTTSFIQALQGLGDTEVNEFLNILQDFDWETGSLEDLRERFKDAGIQINFTDEQLLQFKTVLADLIPTLNGNINTYNEARKILEKLSVGDIVSAEDVQKLKQAGIDVESAFVRMSDGTYKFLDTSSTAIIKMDRQAKELLKNNIRDAEADVAKMQKWATWGSFDAFKTANAAVGGSQGLDFLEAQGVDVTDWRNKVKEGIWTAEDQEALNKKLEEYRTQWEALPETIKTSAEALAQQKTELASTARSIDELETMRQNGQISDADFTQYWENAASIEAQDLGFDYEDIEAEAKSLMRLNKEFANNQKAATEVILAHKRMNKGIQQLSSDIETAAADIRAYVRGDLDDASEAINSLKGGLADTLNTTADTLSDQFIIDNLKDIELAANGDADAIERLRVASATDLVVNSQIYLNGDEEFKAKIDELNDYITSYALDNNLQMDASIDDTKFINKLNEMAQRMNWGTNEMANYLQRLGYDAELDEVPTDVTEEFPVVDYRLEGGIPPQITAHPRMEKLTYTKSIASVKAITYTGDAGGNITTKTKGGGGGSKKKAPQQKFKAKIDPYHDVNIKLKDNEQTLKNLEKQQNKVYGGEALSNLLKQVEVLSKERDLLKEKFDINVRELHNQQEQLKGYGATFDALGRISNYESLLLSKQDQINRLIAQYNAMQEAGADDDALQAINDRISALKEEYSTVESLISEYDNASDQLQALYDEATEDLEKALDKVQEIFKLPIEIGLEIQTREKDWLEFKRDIIDRLKDDDFIGRVEVPLRNIDLIYNDAGTGMAQQLAPALQTALNELAIINAGGFSTLFGTDQTKARQMVEDLYKKSMDQLKDLYDQVEEVEKTYLDQIDAMTDAFDKQLEGYDRIADTIEEDLKIAELLNGEDNYKQFQKLYDQQKLNDQQRVDMRHLQLVVLREQLAAQEQVVRETGEGQEEYKRLQERVINAFQTLNDSIQQSIESATAAWENAMKAMRQQTDEAFFGDRYMFDQMWEYTDWHEDTYLDPLEKANKLLDLQLDFNKEINNANEKNRRNLINLRDKILERLQAQEHIRESDLEMAQRELDVAKAQMALEDARNNKTTMRLRRDSQGNYTYQYVADADNIADRLKDYRDAMEKYRQLALDTVKDIRKELYDAYDESQDKLYEFMEKYRNELDGQEKALRDWRAWMRSDEGKVTLIAEDLVRRLEAIRKSTSLELQGMDSAIGTEELLKQMGVDKASAFGQAIAEMLESAGPNIWDTLINGNTDEVTQILEDKLLGIVDQFDGMYGSAIDRMATHPEETQAQLLEEMETAAALAQEYRDSLSTTQELSGAVFDDYAAGADQALIYNAQLIQDNAELTEGYSNLADTMRDKFVAALEELARHQPEIDSLNATLEQTKNTLNSVDLSQYEDILDLARQRIRDTAGLQYSDDSLAKRITTNSAAGLNSSMPTYDTRTPVNAQADTSAIQSANLQAAIESSQGQTEAVMQAINDSMNQQLQQLFNADQSALGGYDSNLAYNSLAERYNQYIVDQLANIDSSMLDKIAQASDFINQTTSGDNVINQDVHIDASFPNVQSAAEIERAFNNLVNLATQRANTNRRRNNG